MKNDMIRIPISNFSRELMEKAFREVEQKKLAEKDKSKNKPA